MLQEKGIFRFPNIIVVITMRNKLQKNFHLKELKDSTISILKGSCSDKNLFFVERLENFRSMNKSVLDFCHGLTISELISASRFFSKNSLPFLSRPILNLTLRKLKFNYILSLKKRKKIDALSQMVVALNLLNNKKDEIKTINKLIVMDKKNRESWINKRNNFYMKPPLKTPQDIKENHEVLWGQKLSKISAQLKNGEEPISIILNNTMQAPSRASHKPLSGAISNAFIDEYQIQPCSSGLYLESVGCVGSKYTLQSRISPSPIFIKGYVQNDTSSIVELGSGWGRNLFLLHYLLGKRSEDICYYGLEYSDAGQAATEEISNYIKNINIKTGHIDYINPELNIPNNIDGHILFFSNFSVEQVEYIGTGIFDKMLDLDNDFTVVQFEPIGWQRNKEFVNKRKENNDKFF